MKWISLFTPALCFALIGGERSTPRPGAIALASEGELLCSASIIDRNTIVTAAHCLNDYPQILEIKSNNRLQVIENFDIFTHPELDLGIIKTQQNLRRFFGRAILAPFQGSSGLVMSGFGCEFLGQPSEFNFNTATISHFNIQEKQITSSSNPFSGFNPSLCNGDSGGGLYEGDFIIGVNSALYHNYDPMTDAGLNRFVRLTAELLNWINRH